MYWLLTTLLPVPVMVAKISSQQDSFRMFESVDVNIALSQSLGSCYPHARE